MTHLVPNAYDPWIFGPPPLVPLYKRSPTNSVPNTHGQMVPKNSIPLAKWSLEYFVCPGGQAMGIRKYGYKIGWGPFVLGDQRTEFNWNHLSRGINFMGIVCPGGQELRDWKSGYQMGFGPNASQPPVPVL